MLSRLWRLCGDVSEPPGRKGRSSELIAARPGGGVHRRLGASGVEECGDAEKPPPGEAGEKDELSGSGKDWLVKAPKSSPSASGDEDSGGVAEAKLGCGTGEAEAAAEPNTRCCTSSDDMSRPVL